MTDNSPFSAGKWKEVGGGGDDELILKGLHSSSIAYWSAFPHFSATDDCAFFRWCSDGSRFATGNSNYTRRFFYNRPRCLCLHKSFESRRNFFFLSPPPTHPGGGGGGRTRFVFTCVLGRYVIASTVLLVPTLRASLSGTLDVVNQCLEFD